MESAIPVIKVENIRKKYLLGNYELEVLRGITLYINDGDNVAIMGPSGSGKSTLMHIMGCLDVPTSGKVYVKGKDTSHLDENELARIRGKTIGFVFQVFYLLPSLSTIENVALPMVFYGVPQEEREERAKELLKKVGLGHRTTHLPSELSGGERQRVAIARALANNPDVILADEPTGNLDSKSGEEVMRIFKNLNSEGKTIVVVTHDPNIAKHAKRIIRLKDGMIEGIEEN